MLAWVARCAGDPGVLELVERADPVAAPGQVHIAIEAFGLNRSEVVTRGGGSGDAVTFPRVLGIECAGRVLDAPGADLDVGQPVVAVMGGMGRSFDGSYATNTVVPAESVIPIDTSLSWTELAAIPETFLTAWGCLHEGLRIEQNPVPRIVIRPGASALALAAAQIVDDRGGSVIGITRSEWKRDRLLAGGMAHVVVTDGPAADPVRTIWSDGATGVIDTVTSSATIADDLSMRAGRGRICIAGSLSASSGEHGGPDEHGGPGLSVAAALLRPSVVRYSSESIAATTHAPTLEHIVRRVEDGRYRTNIDEIVAFDDLPSAHRSMEANARCGKVVVDVRRDGFGT